jgi:hypothetical protein
MKKAATSVKKKSNSSTKMVLVTAYVRPLVRIRHIIVVV